LVVVALVLAGLALLVVQQIPEVVVAPTGHILPVLKLVEVDRV
jgi:hypothetical protein